MKFKNIKNKVMNHSGIIRKNYYRTFLCILSVTLIFLSGCRFKKNNKIVSKVNKSSDTFKSVNYPLIIAEYGVIAVPYNVINQDTDIKPEPEIEQEELYERRD